MKSKTKTNHPPHTGPYELKLVPVSELKIGEIVFVEDYVPDTVWETLIQLKDGDPEILAKHNIGDNEGQLKYKDVITAFVGKCGYMVIKKIRGGVKLWPVKKQDIQHRVFLGDEVISTGKIISAKAKKGERRRAKRNG